MANKIQIINFALRLIKQSPIVDIDDQNDRARAARDMYEISKRTAFSLCDWHCLRRRAKLVLDAEAPAFGFKYQYTLPVECVRVVGVQDERNGFFIPYEGGMFPDDMPIDLLYTVEQNKILTNRETCNLLYIADTDDTTKYDSQLVNMLAYLLAMNMAIPLSADNALTTAIENKYSYFLKSAKAKNALAEAHPAYTTPFVSKRY